MDFRHVQGTDNGFDYGTNYSTIALLLASDFKPGCAMPMIDLRAHHFDNHKYAANAGLGLRYVPGPDVPCEVLGFNVYYDFRQGKMGNYNQVGGGIEILAKRWEFRANCYFPVGSTKYQITCNFDDYSGGFFAVHRKCEFTSYGYNLDLGYYPVNSRNFSLFTAIGPYFLLRRTHDETLGGLARARFQFRDYLALELKASYDPVFKAVYQASILLRLPLYQLSYKSHERGPCNMYLRQVYQPVERFEIMPLGRRSCWHTNF